MATKEESDAFHHRDVCFAARIANRDKTVLVEIDQAYAPAVYRLTKPKIGPRFSREDLDEVIQDALLDVWQKYNAHLGMTLRTYFFERAKFRTLDRFRENYRGQQRKAVGQLVKEEQYSHEFRPSRRLEAKEVTFKECEVLDLVDAVIEELTVRQRTAFAHRFYTNDSRWAQTLEETTGISARKWSKAAVDAKRKVEKALVSKGVRYNEEDGHYEVA